MKKSLKMVMSLCLAVALLLTAFPLSAFAAETDEHVHDYEVTTHFEYSYYDNTTHQVKEIHTHTCDCGAVYREHHSSYAAHIATGTGTFAYSIWVSEGVTIDYYSYTCKICGGSFTKAKS